MEGRLLQHLQRLQVELINDKVMKCASSIVVLGSAVCLAALALHAFAIFRPMLWYDDFQILANSLTWSSTVANFWRPANEHAMPLGRLTTWGLVQLAGRPAVLPLAAALQGPVALLIGIAILYVLVRRELGHPFYGLVAIALFGVSAGYHQAVSWFAASFALLALDTLLLALLAAQRWQQTGRSEQLILCIFGTALSPAWFAIGILAGPLCCLYLIHSAIDNTTNRRPWGRIPILPGAGRIGILPHRRWLLALAPLLGTVFFLAATLPSTAGPIMHLEHYGQKTALEAFAVRTGAIYTFRALVDNLALGAVGIGNITCPVLLVPVVVTLLAFVTAWWWRPVRPRRLLFLGLGFIFFSYLLIYSARAEWDYDEVGLYKTNWGRYQLLPHLGMTLIVCGGLPRCAGRFFKLDPGGSLSQKQVRAIGLLIAVLFATQLVRGIRATSVYDPKQSQALRHIEEMDARCRANRISGETARQVLETLPVPGSNPGDNGWDFLRGSDVPQSIPMEEVRRLLGH